VDRLDPARRILRIQTVEALKAEGQRLFRRFG
jgi:hypothetical protein